MAAVPGDELGGGHAARQLLTGHVQVPVDSGTGRDHDSACAESATAATTRSTQRVADVDAFPGHIACDSASNSEIVVPIVRDGKLIAVLDIDSPNRARFDAEDEAGCVRLGEILAAAL